MSRKVSTAITQVFLLAAVLLCLAAPAEAAHSDEGGEDFSPSTATVNMGQDWLRKTVHYDDAWAKGADLAVTLDQHLYPALSPLIAKFAKDKGLKIAIQEGTCGISAGRLAQKRVDIGGFCCPPGNTDRLPGLQYHTLGISALGILVNARNTLVDLDAKTVRDLFRGEIQNWSKLLPGANETRFEQPVRVLARLHCKQRPGHWRLILDNEEHFSLRTDEVGTIEAMISKIASISGAIGYEVLWNIKRHQAEGKIKYLRVDGADPTNANDVATNRYPFYRAYNITSWRQGSGIENKDATALVHYLLAHLGEVSPEFDLITADRLREAGWKFNENELLASPND
ncbi:MAG: hypothetical protein KAS94_07650 [Desulfobulbaceae bacterium]|nr:hypothetical protein [Desulfobulbaceae bacterium]